jgi:Arc/MetJ-type ribon-helix-helix transcriptional regulator
MITICLPNAYLDKIEELVNERFFPSRDEAIRMLIHDSLKEYPCQKTARIDKGTATPDLEDEGGERGEDRVR